MTNLNPVQVLLNRAKDIAQETNKTIALLHHDHPEHSTSSLESISHGELVSGGHQQSKENVGSPSKTENMESDSRPKVLPVHPTNRSKPAPKNLVSQNWKKPKTMPKRPLSAYNYFFKIERERLIKDFNNKEISKCGTPDTSSSEPAPVDEKKNRTSNGANPGAIGGFGGLAKHIAKKWKQLSASEKTSFEKAAKQDMKRYRREVGRWRLDQKKKQDQWINSVAGANSRKPLHQVQDRPSFGSSSSKTSNVVGKKHEHQHLGGSSAGAVAPIQPCLEDIILEDLSNFISRQMIAVEELQQGFYSSPRAWNPPSSSSSCTTIPELNDTFAEDVHGLSLRRHESVEKSIQEDLVLSLGNDFDFHLDTYCLSSPIENTEKSCFVPRLTERTEAEKYDMCEYLAPIRKCFEEEIETVDFRDPSNFFDRTEKEHMSAALTSCVNQNTIDTPDHNDDLENFMKFVESYDL
mmetsp:Transcript_25482/g.36277  ORF Transcript_25482/g.36277 Transcript_25482/m.36277 type:complete len:464 (+) Transcript_25482:246-1637(+)